MKQMILRLISYITLKKSKDDLPTLFKIMFFIYFLFWPTKEVQRLVYAGHGSS